MKKLVISLILSSAIVSSAVAGQNFNYNIDTQPVYNEANYVQENYRVDNGTLKGRVVTVPAGQKFRAMFVAPISSETAYNGQEISLVLYSDFFYGDKIIAPAGSSVIGTVIEVSKAKHGTLNGKLTLRFTKIITPNGQNIPISAVINTSDNTGTLVGGTKFDVAKNYAKDIAIGAGAGAILGTIAAPLSGGSVGRGAALMTAVGAGGGLVKSVWDKGNDVEIPVSASVELILTQPITVSPSAS